MTVKDIYDITTGVLFCINRWNEKFGDVTFLYKETEDYSISMSIPTELLNREVKGIGFYPGHHVVDLWIV